MICSFQKNLIIKEYENREKWIDVCRGVAMVLVVLGHSMFPYDKYVYSFHMPLFFMISGYLWSNNCDFLVFFKKIIKRYLIPYFVLCFVNLFIQIVWKRYKLRTILKYVVGIFYSRGTLEWMPNCSPLWFLTALFSTLLLYYFINLFARSSRQKTVFIIVSFFIGYFLSLTDIVKIIWNIDTALVSVVFLYIGNIIKEKKFVETLNLTKKIFLGVISCIFLFASKYNPVDKVSLDDCEYGDALLFLSTSSFISLFIMTLCKDVSKVLKSKFWTLIGQNTMLFVAFDYLSGELFISFVKKVFDINFYKLCEEIYSMWIIYFGGKMCFLLIMLIVWLSIKNGYRKIRGQIYE